MNELLKDWTAIGGGIYSTEIHEQQVAIIVEADEVRWQIDRSAKRGTASTVEEALEQVTEAALRDLEWERDREVAIEHGDMPDLTYRY